ncbi:MAG: type II toxin-antitoxin system RelB/DinJ family antitoxin [Lysobacter sp.]|nr:type II toxin-antitoxin system RelB/DinJ family antitoxin [Lysobacter sp.]
MKTLATDVVRSRVSQELKRDAEAVFSELGLTVSDGIRMFLTQVVRKGTIPFELVPNATTIAAMRESESRATRASANIEDLLDELEQGEGTKRQ